jgi:hypothetical protein
VGVEVSFHLVLTSTLDVGGWSVSKLRPLCLHKNSPRYPVNKGRGWPQDFPGLAENQTANFRLSN